MQIALRPSAMAKYRRRGAFALIEVLIGGILLAIGLTAVLVIASRALDMQRRGERDVIAASLLDEALSNVLSDGPADFVELRPLAGTCDAPFSEFEYEIEVEDGSPGVPYRIIAHIRHRNGQEWSCETYIAPKLGDEPNPIREPEEPIDREARYQEEEDRINGNSNDTPRTR
ncbi:MAG: hypothetical protein SGJ09_08725 [Phycisphaerae bacterium]|nr:hypothetical protein [Phycisphaerae bacterium]